MVTKTDTVSLNGISQLGDTPSQREDTVRLLDFNFGLSDLASEATLKAIADPIPWLYYDGNGANAFRIDSPNLKVPFGSTYDIKGFAGFEAAFGIDLHYQYDFGALAATATVSAERSTNTKVNNTFTLNTGSVSVQASVNSVPATQPFELDLKLKGSGDAEQASFFAGVKDFGVYRNGSAIPGATTDIGPDVQASGDLLPPVSIEQGARQDFDLDYFKGYVATPRLPDLGVSVGGTGAAALDAVGEASGGAEFARVDFNPIGLIPVIGDLNSGSITFIDSYLVSAGVDYTILGTNVSLGLDVEQTLKVSVESVAARIMVQEDTDDDDTSLGDAYLAERQAADVADGLDDNYITVADVTGKLGDTFVIGGFSPGERKNSIVTEAYTVTLRIDADIDIVLKGGLDLSLFDFSAYINPILLDEIRVDIGPVLSKSFSFDLASIEIYDGYILVPLDVASFTYRLGTFADQVGNDNSQTIDFSTDQISIDAKGGDDIVTGNAKPNEIAGGDGNDFIVGQFDPFGAGLANDNDILLGGSGWDQLYGSAGDDYLDSGAAGSGNSPLDFDGAFGGDGNDTLISRDRRSTVDGGAGDDSVQVFLVEGGGQRAIGGSGTDTLKVDATAITENLFIDLSGADFTLLPATGTRQTSTFSGFEIVEIRAGVGNDMLKGGSLGDTLSGGNGDDMLQGGAGNDSLGGDLGDDTVNGEDGNDSVSGGGGDDLVTGGSGDDFLFGNEGDDVLNGGTGNDVLNGGTGNDRLNAGSGQGNDILYGLAGDDELVASAGADQLFGGNGNDILTGGSGNSFLSGENGDDRITFGGGNGTTAFGGRGNDRIILPASNVFGIGYGIGTINGDATDGGNDAGDIDTLDIRTFSTFTSSAGDITVSGPTGFTPLQRLTATGTLAGGTTWANIEAFDVTGDAGVQRLFGSINDDVLRGGGGNDVLHGNRGIDVIDGGTGDDVLWAGIGDTIIGGSGKDYLVFAGGDETGGYSLSIGSLKPGEGGDAVGSGSGGTSITGIELLWMTNGGSGADTVSGGLGNDRIFGGAGSDTLYGEAGNDSIAAEAGNDIVYGGAGDDFIDGRDTATLPIERGLGARPRGDALYGDAGNDTIFATGTARIIEGGTGNDTITIFAGAIDFPTAQTTIDGGRGSDTINGGDRGERIIGGLDPAARSSVEDPLLDINNGFADSNYDGNDILYGNGGDDEIRGGYGADKLFGGDGNDLLFGESGDDQLDGGLGIDTVDGGAGNDSLTAGGNGEESGETLLGGTGNDVLLGSEWADLLDGGDGNDTITGGGGASVGGSDGDIILGGAGNDFISATGDAIITGGAGRDTYSLSDGSQVIRLLSDRNPGIDVAIGFNPGEDRLEFIGPGLSAAKLVFTDTADGLWVRFAGIINAPSIILAGLTAQDLGSGSIVISGPPVAQDDIIVMSSGSLASFEAGVFLANDTGGDLVPGAVSNAVGVVATPLFGNIVIATGAGSGSFDYATSNGLGSDTGSVGVRILTVTAGDDTLAVSSVLARGETAVRTVIDGKDGNDSISGGAGIDSLAGGSGNDTLSGLAGDDVLLGGDGDDVLTGGAGYDQLYGGTGGDRFVFQIDSIRDVIRDFETGDRIDLSAIDASSAIAGNQAFTFIGANEFSGVPGEVRAFAFDGGWLVQANVDRPTGPELSIFVQSPVPLVAADFVL